MSIFWTIYFAGVFLALLYLTRGVIKFCIDNNIDYIEKLKDIDTLNLIVLESLGSWFVIFFLYMEENKKC